MNEITWLKLVELEPQLAALYDEVGHHCHCEGDPVDYWHKEIKPALWPLLGWGRSDLHPVLRTERAYEIAYHTLHDLLQSRSSVDCA